MRDNITILNNQVRLLEINRLIKNTYILLSMTILVSAFATYISVLLNAKHIGYILFFCVALFLLFLINHFKKSIWGIFLVFLFTSFMGYSIGPSINHLLNSSNGSNIILMSLLLTGTSFFSLSIYAILSKKQFNFLGSFLFIGFVLIFFMFIVNMFLSIPLLHLIISGFVVILSSGYILYDTSRMVHGEKTNYILATVSLYLNIFNMFVSLLNIIGGINND